MIVSKILRSEGDYNGIHYVNFTVFLRDKSGMLRSAKLKAKTPLFLIDDKDGDLISESTVGESDIPVGSNINFATDLYSNDISAVFLTIPTK